MCSSKTQFFRGIWSFGSIFIFSIFFTFFPFFHFWPQKWIFWWFFMKKSKNVDNFKMTYMDEFLRKKNINLFWIVHFLFLGSLHVYSLSQCSFLECFFRFPRFFGKIFSLSLANFSLSLANFSLFLANFRYCHFLHFMGFTKARTTRAQVRATQYKYNKWIYWNNIW